MTFDERQQQFIDWALRENPEMPADLFEWANTLPVEPTSPETVWTEDGLRNQRI